jgi:hypothetical protein
MPSQKRRLAQLTHDATSRRTLRPTRQSDRSTRYKQLFIYLTSVDTEMCCPKGKCGCQYFILLTLK